MKEYLKSFVEGVVYSSNSVLLLALIAFAESSFFPIPPDAVLIPLAFLQPEKAIFLGVLTTVFSVLGGAFGYFLGYRGGRPLVKRFVSDEKLYKVKLLYNKYDVWAVMIAGLTPIPYKVFTIAAGLFELNFKRFMLASFIGRGGRFITLGVLIYFFGPTVKPFLQENFELITIGFVVLLIAGFLLVKKLPFGKEGKAVEPQKS